MFTRTPISNEPLVAEGLKWRQKGRHVWNLFDFPETKSDEGLGLDGVELALGHFVERASGLIEAGEDSRLERQSFAMKKCGGSSQNYFPQQDQRYVPSSSLYIFDVYVFRLFAIFQFWRNREAAKPVSLLCKFAASLPYQIKNCSAAFSAVVVAQLVEQSIPTPEIHSLHLVIGKILSTNCAIE